jgi:hypothetical protein
MNGGRVDDYGSPGESRNQNTLHSMFKGFTLIRRHQQYAAQVFETQGTHCLDGCGFSESSLAPAFSHISILLCGFCASSPHSHSLTYLSCFISFSFRASHVI